MWQYILLVDLRKNLQVCVHRKEFVFEENEAVLDCAKEIIAY